jgi:hypothetical protein
MDGHCCHLRGNRGPVALHILTIEAVGNNNLLAIGRRWMQPLKTTLPWRSCLCQFASKILVSWWLIFVFIRGQKSLLSYGFVG